MSSTIFRHNKQTACATCGLEWFGKGGEAAARKHATTTGHQVQILILHQETINPVAHDADPDYAPLEKLAPAELAKSVEAARERVSLFETVIGARSGSVQQRVSS